MMDTVDNPHEHTGRRLRLTTLNEQLEFISLARRLRESGVGMEELERELGYEDSESLRVALDSGRATTHRLQRLRELASARLPALLEAKREDAALRAASHMDTLFQQLRGDVQAAESAPAVQSNSVTRKRAQKQKRAPARGPKRQFLTTKQHARLREQVEHLWAVDKRFRNWSLLARVMGLATGQAAKRAYDVNSSTRTLQNLETFARLHAAFGSKASNALRAGVLVGELQAHLMQGAAPSVPAPPEASSATAVQDAGAQPAEESAAAWVATLSRRPDTPPQVDFTQLLEVGNAIDAEVKRIHHMVRFFDGVAELTTLPSMIRWQAAQTRDRLWDALQYFAPNGRNGVPAEGEKAVPDQDTA